MAPALLARITAAAAAAVLACTAPAAQADVIRLSEPVEVTATHETFGAPLPEAVSAMRLADLMAKPDALVDQTVVVETRVAKVCQKKGCFFIAQDGPHVARVSFIDYSFFVPTDIADRTVTLAGELIRRDVGAAEAAHLSEDAGARGAVQAGLQYEIVATSVRVPRIQAAIAP